MAKRVPRASVAKIEGTPLNNLDRLEEKRLSDESMAELWATYSWDQMDGDNGLIQRLEDRRNARHSPDFLDWKHHSWILLFLYEKPRYALRELLYHTEATRDQSFYLGKAVTQTWNFQLMTDQETWRPVALKSRGSNSYKLEGEVWAVSPVTLLELDRLYQANLPDSPYHRGRVFAKLVDQEYQTKNGKARVVLPTRAYFGNDSYWMKRKTFQEYPYIRDKDKVLRVPHHRNDPPRLPF